MTRTAAREIAVRLTYLLSVGKGGASDALDAFFSPEYYAGLAAEDRLFAEYPNEAQLSYIRRVAEGTDAHRDELDAYISEYSSGWKLGRISKTAVAALEVALFELLYMRDEIPRSAAINEAVAIAKNYETPETAAFINGILGSFCRANFPDEAATAREADDTK